MTELEQIEQQIRDIFTKESITKLDVNTGNLLFERWKTLTGYISDKSPVCKDCTEMILDNKPKYK